MSTDSVPKTPASVSKEAPSVPKAAPEFPKIPGMPPDMPLQHEFATYLLAAPRLIAEGHAGRYALVKGGEILNLFDTTTAVLEAGYDRFGLDEPFAVFKIEPRDLERVAAIAAREGMPWPP